MTRQQTLLARAGALCLAALTLAGCGIQNVWQETPEDYTGDVFVIGRWHQMKRVPDNRVEHIAVEHDVAFEKGSARMTDAERQRLVEFLQRSGIGRGDRVTLYGPLRDQGRHDPVTEARLQFVRGELMARGIDATAPLVQRSGPELADGVAVVVSRNVVISPDCEQPPPPPGRRPHFVMGCADTANLGKMIVDPLDLEHGRLSDPADGDAAAQSIKRYHERKTEKVQDIKAESTD